jgi:hypothetical protein
LPEIIYDGFWHILLSNRNIASSLKKLGLQKEDVVSIISPNAPAIFPMLKAFKPSFLTFSEVLWHERR